MKIWAGKMIVFSVTVILLGSASAFAAVAPFRTVEYPAMKTELMRGWNTWDTRSVLTHVLLPEGLAVRLQLRAADGRVLKSALIGRRGRGVEVVRPGPRSYDGSYTEVTVEWQGIKVRVQSAAVGNDLVILVTPEAGSAPGALIIQPEIFYGRPGSINLGSPRSSVALNGNAGLEPGTPRVGAPAFLAHLPGSEAPVFIEGPGAAVRSRLFSEVFTSSLSGPIGISTGLKRSVAEINSVIDSARRKLAKDSEKYGDLVPVHNAMQTVLAWNVIYDPSQDRVLVPVSRIWNVNWGGYVIFDWDSYFASYMLSLDSRELAYAMAVEVTRGITYQGFIPNYAQAGELGTYDSHKSLDRSQPPVGSLICREIYRHWREEWFLREVFDDLLTWNRWWEQNRVIDGYLAWGSHRYKWDWLLKPKEMFAINHWQGAAWESGLDNSPMYDGVPFDRGRNVLLLADVGLMSFFVSDCDALADIAEVLGRPEAGELRARAEKWRKALGGTWMDDFGLFLNRRTDTGEFIRRISPTNFYPLLARAATPVQAGRMMREHFYNPDEFWGEWIMPSISRNDPAFADNTYWRGRIWAPMNFLVYMGMRNYGDGCGSLTSPEVVKARKDLVDKSAALLLKSWNAEGHVYENYNAVTGVGDDVENADKFYHWGALLGFIGFIEQGFVEGPEGALQ